MKVKKWKKNENEKNENDEVKIIKKCKDVLGSLIQYSFLLGKLKKIATKIKKLVFFWMKLSK